uniref:Ion transport domain-containing protein n=1 Tax=uncultured Elusimicrobia bacterium TaxID=699876 RepID=A0A650ELR6_9BACT|nr:hypothetical protein Elusimicrob1349_1690 [uncultured Elusimicrobia bacterium]
MSIEAKAVQEVRRTKRYLFDVLQFNYPSKVTWTINAVIITLILLSVPVDVIESVGDVSPQLKRLAYHVDLGMSVIFALEYVLRVLTCTEDPRYQKPISGRIKYMLTPLMIIDLLAISPFFILGAGLVRALRVFRIFMLMRYTNAIELVNNVVSEKKNELAICGAFLLMLWIWSSFMIFRVEHPAQPEVFKNMLDAMWWSMQTFTTLGYGNLVPITLTGKIITGITVASGLILFAVVTAVMTGGVVQEFQKYENKKKTPPQI